MKFSLYALLSLFTFNAWACPNLEGSFFDSDSETVRTIVQSGCTSTSWSDEEGTTTLVADNIERVLQKEGNMTAYAKVSFTPTDLIIDIRMDWGGNNEFDLPVRFLTSYKIDKYNNLVEKIEPFKEDGSASGIEYITFRRVK